MCLAMYLSDASHRENTYDLMVNYWCYNKNHITESDKEMILEYVKEKRKRMKQLIEEIENS